MQAIDDVSTATARVDATINTWTNVSTVPKARLMRTPYVIRFRNSAVHQMAIVLALERTHRSI